LWANLTPFSLQSGEIQGEANAAWGYSGSGAAFVLGAGAHLQIEQLEIGAESGLAFRLDPGATLTGSPQLSSGLIACSTLTAGVYALAGLACTQAEAGITLAGPTFVSVAGESLPLSFVQYQGPVPADFFDALDKHAAGLYTLTLGADFDAAGPV
jgi:hypothetical protein